MSEEGYWSHIEEAYEKVSIYDGSKVFLGGLKKYPAWVGDLLAAHWLCGEHLNGGLMQLFLNDTGVVVPEAIAALRKMKQTAAANAVEAAIELFDSTYPRDRKKRLAMLAAMSGHKPSDKNWKPYESNWFKPMEKRLDKAGGGPSLDKVYAAMDAYAAAFSKRK